MTQKEINISGIALMSAKESAVKITPSTNKGIYFNINGVSILASANNVVSTDNCVVISNGDGKLALIEHFMAACAFCNIDSLNVEVQGSELPILDGSSKMWVDAFKQAGIEEAKEQKINFKEPIFYENGKTSIVLIPSNEFKITYAIDFNHPNLSNRWVCFDENMNKQEIIEARTFGYLKDLEKFQKMGLALGASIDNTVGLTDDSFTVELRSDLEPVKHKVLDIVGDLYLSGVNPLNINAHIIAKNAGHKSHVEFAKMIIENMEKE